jgi:hypothetical protein
MSRVKIVRKCFFIATVKLIIRQFELFKRKSYFKETMQEQPKKEKYPANAWIKRFGVAGFLFFLIKFLLCLIVPSLIAYFSL